MQRLSATEDKETDRGSNNTKITELEKLLAVRARMRACFVSVRLPPISVHVRVREDVCVCVCVCVCVYSS
jgi:hypothetical protein